MFKMDLRLTKCIWNLFLYLELRQGFVVRGGLASKGWDTALGRSGVACRVELGVLGSNS